MSSGKTHDLVTWFCLPWVGGVAYWFLKDGFLALLLAAGFLMGGLMFGPDLDIHSVQFKRWGYLRWLWQPYQMILEHRSWLSHGPVIGTTLRLIYFCGMLALVGSVVMLVVRSLTQFSWDVQISLQWLFRWATAHQMELGVTIAGLELGALSHIFMDGLSSALNKRPFKKRSRRKS
jgi:uncharacterized metal-binding protein